MKNKNPKYIISVDAQININPSDHMFSRAFVSSCVYDIDEAKPVSVEIHYEEKQTVKSHVESLLLDYENSVIIFDNNNYQLSMELVKNFKEYLLELNTLGDRKIKGYMSCKSIVDLFHTPEYIQHTLDHVVGAAHWMTNKANGL
jgi:hypothetical protein|tara:strand:+ start:89 stop:520 length:432 start_codon:yes stop_codon:yes gene_type:complete